MAPQKKRKYEVYSKRVRESRERFLSSLEHLKRCEDLVSDISREAANYTTAKNINFRAKLGDALREQRAAKFVMPHKLFLPNGTSVALVR